MTTQDQIKAVAADFLRALATVPGLFARWQADATAEARGTLVRTELGLDYTPTANDLARMAEVTQPAVNAGALRGPVNETPNFVAFAHKADRPAAFIAMSHEAMPAAFIAMAHEAGAVPA